MWKRRSVIRYKMLPQNFPRMTGGNKEDVNHSSWFSLREPSTRPPKHDAELATPRECRAGRHATAMDMEMETVRKEIKCIIVRGEKRRVKCVYSVVTRKTKQQGRRQQFNGAKSLEPYGAMLFFTLRTHKNSLV